MFERLRNYSGETSYPKKCGSFAVTAVRDLTTGYDSNQLDNKAVCTFKLVETVAIDPKFLFSYVSDFYRCLQVLPTSKSSQMITFSFANGGVATIRTSGTEPKIKYYTELCAAPGNRFLKSLHIYYSILFLCHMQHQTIIAKLLFWNMKYILRWRQMAF